MARDRERERDFEIHNDTSIGILQILDDGRNVSASQYHCSAAEIMQSDERSCARRLYGLYITLVTLHFSNCY